LSGLKLRANSNDNAGLRGAQSQLEGHGESQHQAVEVSPGDETGPQGSSTKITQNFILTKR
jgi:hypothetical protein